MTHAVHISTVHNRYDNRILFKQCRSLVKAGYRVTLIAQGDLVENVDGVTIQPIPTTKSRTERFCFSGFRAFQCALRSKGDLFHLHDPELLPWGVLLRLLKRKPVIFDMHENIGASIMTKPWIPTWLRLPLSVLVKHCEVLMLKFHAVIFAEKSYVACFPSLERTEVVQNFPQVANLRRLRGQPKFRQFTVGYIGAISLTRGFGETLEVLSSLDKQGLSIAFECIGPLRPEAATYFEHWKTRNLDTSMRVNLRGFMPAEEGLKTIARCQVGLALLQPSPNYLGSYPTKIFEYMALGIPFITSNFPLYQEIVETYQCGICVDPLDKLQVANAIQKLASDNNLLEEMGRKGIEAAESTFSWDREESKLLEFYRNVLRV